MKVECLCLVNRDLALRLYKKKTPFVGGLNNIAGGLLCFLKIRAVRRKPSVVAAVGTIIAHLHF